MITKEDIKKEVDRLPENLLEEVYVLLKRVVSKRKKKSVNLTLRDFKGTFDNIHIRSSAYE
jgi:hypothetical protein